MTIIAVPKSTIPAVTAGMVVPVLGFVVGESPPLFTVVDVFLLELTDLLELTVSLES